MGSKKIVVVVAVLVVVALAAVLLKRSRGGGSGDNFSYTLGHEYAMNLKRQQVEVDIPEFLKGAEDVLKNKKSRLTEEEMRAALVEHQKIFDQQIVEKAKANKEVGEKWLLEYRSKEGVKFLPSGMHFKVLTEGKGPKPKADDVVTVHYTGKLIDGTEFDSSRKPNPVDLNLKTVIPGWQQALSMMPVGSKWEVALPAQLAYGDQVHPRIPPGSTLLFEIELFGIKGAPKAEKK
jgi:FKBP-type peptidyl-prolyl cis-trans isomerase